MPSAPHLFELQTELIQQTYLTLVSDQLRRTSLDEIIYAKVWILIQWPREALKVFHLQRSCNVHTVLNRARHGAKSGVVLVCALGGLVLTRIQFEGVFHMYSLDHENLFVQLDFTDGFGCQPAFAGGDIARLQRASEGAGQSTRGRCYEVIEGCGMSGMNSGFMLVVLGNLRMG